MSTELFVAILGGLIGLLGFLVSWRTARASAKKDELEVLRGIIAELRTERDEDQRVIEGLRRFVGELRGGVRALKAENVKLRRRVTDVETENKQLRQLVNRLEAENARLKYEDNGG